MKLPGRTTRIVDPLWIDVEDGPTTPAFDNDDASDGMIFEDTGTDTGTHVHLQDGVGFATSLFHRSIQPGISRHVKTPRAPMR